MNNLIVLPKDYFKWPIFLVCFKTVIGRQDKEKF